MHPSRKTREEDRESDNGTSQLVLIAEPPFWADQGGDYRGLRVFSSFSGCILLEGIERHTAGKAREAV